MRQSLRSEVVERKSRDEFVGVTIRGSCDLVPRRLVQDGGLRQDIHTLTFGLRHSLVLVLSLLSRLSFALAVVRNITGDERFALLSTHAHRVRAWCCVCFRIGWLLCLLGIRRILGFHLNGTVRPWVPGRTLLEYELGFAGI